VYRREWGMGGTNMVLRSALEGEKREKEVICLLVSELSSAITQQ
jgi:hypothetical protein